MCKCACMREKEVGREREEERGRERKRNYKDFNVCYGLKLNNK